MDSSAFSFLDEIQPDVPEMNVCGLFAIADSTITTPVHGNDKTLLNGFKKIYELEAKLWKPYFLPDGFFKGYRYVHQTQVYFIGFAGNTLVAQHILNNVTEHLGQLKITYAKGSEGGYFR